MTETSPVRVVVIQQQRFYRAGTVRRKFGWTNAKGETVPITDSTLYRWRKAGLIPFVEVRPHSFRYPVEQVDNLVMAKIHHD